MGEVLEPCASCKASCCVNFRVCLTVFDIKRIANATSLSPLDFCELVREEEVKHYEKASIFLTGRNGKMGSYLPCLKRRRNGHCVFLEKNFSCSLYENRPRVCRCYPFRLDSSGKIAKVNNFRCPGDWKKEEIEREGYGEGIMNWDEECEKFAVICRRWNNTYGKTPGKGFLDFLEYAQSKSASTTGA